ncbi:MULTISPECIES: DUF4229 domain-containing protein [unclassified Streptomyces]|uniref:DUF4229 domain-containing protein n=1 Tax=unclassified Streptomyces TaxID=2593676 RepID=UPI000A9F1EE1|nr:DUF4229 domain-containing protein [Streptomyces sp. NBC_00370]
MSLAKPSATVRYTGMRIAIFMGCLVLSAALVHVGVLPKGLGDSNFIWVLLLALVLSAPLSFVLLRKQRDEMSVQLSGRVESVKAKLEANRTQEDGVAE